MIEIPEKPTHVIAICGGAVAGSEAAALAAERGALVVVFEQNERPYGKIEDGLPRWHLALRKKEYERIDQNLTKPGVLFVPRTKVGRDVSLEDLAGSFSALVLANGAWRDRPLVLPGMEKVTGLVYQNPFVYWFNHKEDPGYSGARYEIPDGAIVVGGGLASIDVVKILNLEIYGRALAARGIHVPMIELEVKGIDAALEKHGLTQEALGVKGCTLFYRRRKQDMPLASAEDAPAGMLAKIEAARCKIMDKVIRKYLVAFEECAVPVAPIDDNGKLGGLVFRRSEIDGGKLVEKPGTEFEVRAGLVVSSIGSVPEPIEGIATKGELYLYKSWETGEVEGRTGVFGLGNVLTGKGNIKASRENSRDVMSVVAEQFLGLSKGDLAPSDPSAEVTAVVDAALTRAPLEPQAVAKLLDVVRERWSATGYEGYDAWKSRHPASS